MNIDSKAIKHLLIFLIVLSIVVIFIYWLEMDRDTSISYSNDKSEATVNGNLPESRPDSESSSFNDRKIIANGDQLPVSKNEEKSAPQPEEDILDSRIKSGDILLSAVVIADDKRLALVQTGNNEKLQMWLPGDNIDGWTITEILEKEIIFTRGSERKNLKLLVKGSPANRNPPGQQTDPGLDGQTYKPGVPVRITMNTPEEEEYIRQLTLDQIESMKESHVDDDYVHQLTLDQIEFMKDNQADEEDIRKLTFNQIDFRKDNQYEDEYIRQLTLEQSELMKENQVEEENILQITLDQIESMKQGEITQPASGDELK